jgi:DNA-binding protein HU-beta
MAFGKTQLVDQVAASIKVPKKTAAAAIDAVFASMMSALEAEGAASIIGFGSFKVVERAERSGRNPGTGAAITIAAHKAVRFTAGKKLKDAVNQGGKKKGPAKKAKPAAKKK